ncbi:MAG: DNA alkylation repair protein [Prevotella sp.]|jgi:hypothetical protein|nr:DNA alkylation repair protein [Prevotella sp.]MBO5625246.1 DNA alkylation repair protein [Prevotella sp.]MBO6255164.1 DNA alkylation repair protein [Bacteroidaceae bacterium]
MEDINLLIKEIKQSFRQMMDGTIAQSMRDKGVNYHLNWGATIPRLKDKAEELREQTPTTDDQYTLAIALWKENVRECKILATMLMPADRILPEVVDIWMEQIPSQEIAEQAAFNLWQHLPFAAEKAFQWIASEREYDQLCGFHVLSRLMMNCQEPNERGINELLDQSIAALQGPFPSVRKAAMQSVQRFAELGLVYERLAKSAMKSINLDFF